MADIKNFLYAWCGKKKLTPNYDIRAAGNKNRQKFLCEVRIRPRPLKATCKLYIKILYNQRCFFGLNHVLFKVRLEGYNYIGMGNSTNKKDAQSNAARDFVNYLVRTKEVSASEVPALGVSITSVFTSSSTTHLYYERSG